MLIVTTYLSLIISLSIDSVAANSTSLDPGPPGVLPGFEGR